jgi:hypothetical protein
MNGFERKLSWSNRSTVSVFPDDNHGKLQSGESVSRPRIEPSTFRIQVYSVTPTSTYPWAPCNDSFIPLTISEYINESAHFIFLDVRRDKVAFSTRGDQFWTWHHEILLQVPAHAHARTHTYKGVSMAWSTWSEEQRQTLTSIQYVHSKLHKTFRHAFYIILPHK